MATTKDAPATGFVPYTGTCADCGRKNTELVARAVAKLRGGGESDQHYDLCGPCVRRMIAQINPATDEVVVVDEGGAPLETLDRRATSQLRESAARRATAADLDDLAAVVQDIRKRAPAARGAALSPLAPKPDGFVN
jgi:hypothetical protein